MNALVRPNIPALTEAFASVRQRTQALVSHLSAEDCNLQSMEDASPAKWHLAHTTWFWETFLLTEQQPDYQVFDPDFRQLFNSYYNGVSEQFPRGRRGLLTRPALTEILAYRAHVDTAVIQLLQTIDQDGADAWRGARAVVELGLNHEQQHQELIVTDLQHLFHQNPLGPVCFPPALNLLPARPPAAATSGPAWLDIEPQLRKVGFAGDGFCFDNELPAHQTYLNPYSIATGLVTCAEFAEFINDGGYTEPAWWLSEGFAWLRQHNISHPIYWRGDGQQWSEFTLHGYQPIQPDAPVAYLSYFEADAYARYAGARLPTEFEWEGAARLARGHGDHIDASGRAALQQLDDTVWQWTSSSYAAYPGFRTSADAIGEYNGKFMVNQYVLRGGSFLTPPGHTRLTYRNFFPAGARWQATGIRLARDRERG